MVGLDNSTATRHYIALLCTETRGATLTQVVALTYQWSTPFSFIGRRDVEILSSSRRKDTLHVQ